MSRLFTDSDCELWFDQLELLGVENIEMPYNIGDQEYMYDLGKTTDFKAFFDGLRAGKNASTSALNAENYKDIIEPVFANGEDILYVSFSHAMSGTFNQLRTALAELKEKYPERKFVMFNTNAISYAAGIQVVEAAKMKKTGTSDEKIVEKLKEISQQTCCYFFVDDLMHLKRGGRLSTTAAIAGSLLKLKPVLTFDGNGELKVVNKIVGRKAAMKFLVDQVVANAVEGDFEYVVLHADCEAEAQQIVDQIKAAKPNINIRPQTVGPVIGAHCGPNLLGVVYFANQRPIPVTNIESSVEVF